MHDGRALKLLTVLDEHTRECLAIVVARKIRSHDVLEVLADLFVRHGHPEYLRSDNGPEFTAKLVRRWLGRVGVETLFIEPGSGARQLNRMASALDGPSWASVVVLFSTRVANLKGEDVCGRQSLDVLP